MVSSRSKGASAEGQAAEYLNGLGFEILERNYSLFGNYKGGEIDIIARRDDVIHFIEVKARNTDTFGTGREAVRGEKPKTIRRLATHYLVKHGLWDLVAVSLDIIEITNGKIEYLENCF